ncbi:MAG TPA: hypothetical protein VH459_06425 [Gaiellales bacterium]
MSSPAIAVSVAAVLVAAWVAGSCVLPDRPALERFGAGLLALYAVAGIAMLQGPLHLSFLAHTWLVRAVSVAGLAALIAWRRPTLRPAGVRALPLAGAAVLVALMAIPAWRAPVGSHAVSHQDMQWHEGWIRQLLGGAHAPGGIYAGEPNSYPWLYHALSAWIAQALPGGVDEALVAVDILGLVTLAAGMWLLARELGGGTTAAGVATLLALAGGGFGWFWQHSPAAVLNTSAGDLGTYHGDLVLSNALVPGMGNLPPLVPRDLGVCMAPLVLWAFVRALDSRSRTGFLAAGAAGGLAFLCAPLAGVFLALWAAGLALRAREPAALWAGLAGVVSAGIWLAPLAVTYHRYGGFVDITSAAATNPTVWQAVVALGVALPLGVAGLILAVRAPSGMDPWRLVILAAIPAAACALGVVMGEGGTVLGTAALLRWLRYVPFLALGLAVPAGLAAERGLHALTRIGRPAAALALAAGVLAAVASTALAAVELGRSHAPASLRCSSLPFGYGDVFAVVTRPQLDADRASVDAFSQTGAAAAYMTLFRAKVRPRTFPDRPPTQAERRRWRDELRAGRSPIPGGVWVVADAGSPAAVGGTRVAACTLAGRPAALVRYPPA